jgi:fructose-bisphosphate aldolase class I
MITTRNAPLATSDHADIPAMETTAAALMAPGKGILAADESFPTIRKRFAAFDIASNEETRRAYRELLFTTPGLDEFISGGILFEETLYQKTSDGIPLPEYLARHGIIAGVKVDRGTSALPGFVGEKMTLGLDGLRERLAEFKQCGARFTKWRAIHAMGNRIPTATCIETNARTLGLFASLSQEAGLVPIVESEVLMDGNHTLARCEKVTQVTLEAVFRALADHRVALDQMLLKTAMVLPGEECPDQADVASIARATLRCLRRSVPAKVAGIVFLSGGQTAEAATQRLNAICATSDVPWRLSFSFGRALQAPALKTWAGQAINREAAQEALHHRACCNSFAVQGGYSDEEERADEK